MRGPVPQSKSPKSDARYIRLLRDASNSENLLRLSLNSLESTNAIGKTLELLNVVLVTFKDIIALDPALAYKEKVPERLFRSVMSCFSICLESSNSKYSKEFDFLFDEITSYYQFLLISLYGNIEDIYKATAENFKSYIDKSNNTHLGPALRLIHDCFIYLGNIMKTVALSEKFNKETSRSLCNLALKNYHKAWIVYYGSAIPLALIASVNLTLKNDTDTLYWFTLSLGSSFTPQWAKSDLVAFLKEKVPQSGANPNTDNLPILYDVADFVLNVIISVDKQGTNYINTLLEICDRMSPKFFKYSSEQTSSTDRSRYNLPSKETKIISVLNCLFYYLNKIFTKSDHPSKRQRIRLSQVIITLESIVLLGHMLSLVCPKSLDHINEDEEESFSEPTISLIKDSPLWEPISLSCFCLSVDNSQMKVFKEYRKEFHQFSKRISKTIVDFCRFVSIVANEIIFIRKQNAPRVLVPEDTITLGLKQTSVHYKGCSIDELKQFFEHPCSINENTFEARISRVLSLAKLFSEIFPEVLVLSNDNEYEKFVVYDERRKEIEATKLMKALAAERLRDQVKSLKGLYKRMKLNIPTAILAADCYTNNLNLVKRWINAKNCTVIVPLCVISDLDYLKKSGSKEATISNEASRYIETILRHNSEYVRPQKNGEQSVIWDYAGRVHNSNIVVPKSLRDLMSVSLYYRNLTSFMPWRENRSVFAVVTDSLPITKIARDLEINVYKPIEWAKFLDKCSCSHNNFVNVSNSRKNCTWKRQS